MQVGLINSALMISVGSLFCQLSDSTDNIDRVQYLLYDIKEAALANGAANGFIVALDGACKATLNLIYEDRGIKRTFPQRCTTLGCNLFVDDVGKIFQWEILFFL